MTKISIEIPDSEDKEASGRPNVYDNVPDNRSRNINNIPIDTNLVSLSGQVPSFAVIPEIQQKDGGVKRYVPEQRGFVEDYGRVLMNPYLIQDNIRASMVINPNGPLVPSGSLVPNGPPGYLQPGSYNQNPFVINQRPGSYNQRPGSFTPYQRSYNQIIDPVNGVSYNPFFNNNQRQSLIAGELPPARAESFNPLLVTSFVDSGSPGQNVVNTMNVANVTGVYNSKTDTSENIELLRRSMKEGSVSKTNPLVEGLSNGMQNSQFATSLPGAPVVIKEVSVGGSDRKGTGVNGKDRTQLRIEKIEKVFSSGGTLKDFYKTLLDSRNSNNYVLLFPETATFTKGSSKPELRQAWKVIKNVVKSPVNLLKSIYDKITRESDIVNIAGQKSDRSCISFSGNLFFEDIYSDIVKVFDVSTTNILSVPVSIGTGTGKGNGVDNVKVTGGVDNVIGKVIISPILTNICYNSDSYRSMLSQDFRIVEFVNAGYNLKIFDKTSYIDDLYGVKVGNGISNDSETVKSGSDVGTGTGNLKKQEYICSSANLDKVVKFIDNINSDKTFFGYDIKNEDDLTFVIIQIVTCGCYRDFITQFLFENTDLTRTDCVNLGYGIFIAFLGLNIPFKFGYNELCHIAYLYYRLHFNTRIEDRYVLRSSQMLKPYIIALSNKRAVESKYPVFFKNNTKQTYLKDKLDSGNSNLPQRLFARVVDVSNVVKDKVSEVIGKVGNVFRKAEEKPITVPLQLYNDRDDDSEFNRVNFSYDYENPTNIEIKDKLSLAKIDGTSGITRKKKSNSISDYQQPKMKSDVVYREEDMRNDDDEDKEEDKNVNDGNDRNDKNVNDRNILIVNEDDPREFKEVVIPVISNPDPVVLKPIIKNSVPVVLLEPSNNKIEIVPLPSNIEQILSSSSLPNTVRLSQLPSTLPVPSDPLIISVPPVSSNPSDPLILTVPTIPEEIIIDTEDTTLPTFYSQPSSRQSSIPDIQQIPINITQVNNQKDLRRLSSIPGLQSSILPRDSLSPGIDDIPNLQSLQSPNMSQSSLLPNFQSLPPNLSQSPSLSQLPSQPRPSIISSLRSKIPDLPKLPVPSFPKAVKKTGVPIRRFDQEINKANIASKNLEMLM